MFLCSLRRLEMPGAKNSRLTNVDDDRWMGGNRREARRVGSADPLPREMLGALLGETPACSVQTQEG
jgi:hypothetical protein